MTTTRQNATAGMLVLLSISLFLAAASFTANAQTSDQVATVILLPVVGGTTSPSSGGYDYPQGQVITLAATPLDGWEFGYWIVTGNYTPGHTQYYPDNFTDTDIGTYPIIPKPGDSTVFTANPVNITCGYGFTYQYQAVFYPASVTPTTTPPPQTQTPTNTSQVVTILPSVGGSTSPLPGTYVYANTSSLTLSATASSGYTFHYWVVRGTYTPGHLAQPQYIPGVTEQVPSVPQSIYTPTQDSVVFATNPVTITCGYGYTYEYQAIFDPVNATVPVIPTATPVATATATPTSTATQTATATATATASASATATPAPAGTDYTLPIIAVVIVIIIVIAIVVVMMMRKK